MDRTEQHLSQSVSLPPLIETFESDQRPIFVVYGCGSGFPAVVEEFVEWLQTAAAYLYLPINMKAEKRENPGDTLFEVIHQIIDTLLDKAHSNEEQFQLFQVFRMLENLKKRTREADPEDKLAEFMGFAESVCYPNLTEILGRRDQPCMIGLTHFEHVAEWGSKIRNFLVDRLLRRSSGHRLRFVLFVQTPEPPVLFYGSNQEGSEKQVSFHKLAEGLTSGENKIEYKDNYRTEAVEVSLSASQMT